MICARCNNNSPLWIVDGGCNACETPEMPHKPTRIACKRRTPPDVSKLSRKHSYAYTDATRALWRKCQNVMDEQGISKTRLAINLALPPNSFRAWFDGQYTEHGQVKFNERVRIALDECVGVTQDA